VRGEDRGWLVEDEDRGIGRERPCDLDPLTRSDRKIRDPRIRVAEIEIVRPGEAQDPPASGRRGLDEGTGPIEERQVVGDRRGLDEKVVLRDEGDPAPASVTCRLERALAAAEANRAIVGPEKPGRDGDERRLAGAVLAEEGVDLAGEDRQRGVVERPGLPEALRDSEKLEKRQKLPRGTVRAPEAISVATRETSSTTAGGTELFCDGLQTNEMTPDARP